MEDLIIDMLMLLHIEKKTDCLWFNTAIQVKYIIIILICIINCIGIFGWYIGHCDIVFLLQLLWEDDHMNKNIYLYASRILQYTF